MSARPDWRVARGTSIVRKLVELLAALLSPIDTNHARLFKKSPA